MRKIIKWQIAKLKTYPQQEKMFGDVSDAELSVLVESLREEGLRDPIEILPDGTVICGHQRVRAARILGWTEIDAIVRKDLADAGVDATEKHFITDNFARRQLSPLGRARCIKRLLELEMGRELAKGGYTMRETLKKKIANFLGCSPRTINRYLLVLNTPPDVQTAFDRDLLDLKTTGQISLSPASVQREIAKRIRDGEVPKVVARAYLGKSKVKFWRPGFAYSRFIRALNHAVAELDGGQLGDVKPFVCNREPLQAAHMIIAELLANVQVDEGHGVPNNHTLRDVISVFKDNDDQPPLPHDDDIFGIDT